ncbi:hypothetical protein EC396_07595 [Lutibacter sp. HS1-25]|nr:hypothetical protein EC396_07595 [Lutibacter sp. HS1-25]
MKAQEVKVYEIFNHNPQENLVPQNKSTKSAKTTLAAVENNSYAADLNNFYDLNYNLKPTIYIANNAIAMAPDNQNPVKVILEDVKSLNILKTINPVFQTVELIEINVESLSELNTIFDVATLQSFSSLKYIYVQCNQFSTSVAQMQRFVINTGSSITVYFMTINPS